MNIYDFAQEVLYGENLESKMMSHREISDDAFQRHSGGDINMVPGREKRISFSEKRVKFPKKDSFHLDEKKGLALHFFANHELLAIEMLAAFILKFPSSSKSDLKIKKGILSTIEDEQKHFKLYCTRMKDFGLEFGDYPLNDFFWKRLHGLKEPEEFFALMSLTFEAANLDFALLYSNIFKEVEDEKSSSILNTVYEDEIRHVHFGVKALEWTKGERSMWDYYNELLPEGITPARSKGIVFDELSRRKAGLDPDFVEKVKNYHGDFKVTQRKEWKK